MGVPPYYAAGVERTPYSFVKERIAYQTTTPMVPHPPGAAMVLWYYPARATSRKKNPTTVPSITTKKSGTGIRANKSPIVPTSTTVTITARATSAVTQSETAFAMTIGILQPVRFLSDPVDIAGHTDERTCRQVPVPPANHVSKWRLIPAERRLKKPATEVIHGTITTRRRVEDERHICLIAIKYDDFYRQVCGIPKCQRDLTTKLVGS